MGWFDAARINSRVRLISHRAQGFHSADAMIAMIDLCCAGDGGIGAGLSLGRDTGGLPSPAVSGRSVRGTTERNRGRGAMCGLRDRVV